MPTTMTPNHLDECTGQELLSLAVVHAGASWRAHEGNKSGTLLIGDHQYTAILDRRGLPVIDRHLRAAIIERLSEIDWSQF